MGGAFHPPRRKHKRHGINLAPFLLILSVLWLWNVPILVGFMSWPSVRSDELKQSNELISELGLGFPRAPQSIYGTTRGTVSVAVVIPFMDADIDRLVEAMGAWSDVGHACSPLQHRKVGLFFTTVSSVGLASGKWNR